MSSSAWAAAAAGWC
ncbi:hypothetical protein HaLaN_31740, partial [Haematococcus lacustris]